MFRKVPYSPQWVAPPPGVLKPPAQLPGGGAAAARFLVQRLLKRVVHEDRFDLVFPEPSLEECPLTLGIELVRP